VSFHKRPTQHDLTREFRYLVNGKAERGTLREVLRSGAELDPVKLVRKLALVDGVVC
jgi:hypothetical protein